MILFITTAVKTSNPTRAYRVLVENPTGTRPQGRPRCRWADNITVDLKK
jgi:hypothetical protein